MSVSLDEDEGSSDEGFLRCFPLHRACRDGDVRALLSLSRQSVSPLTAEDSCYGWTPIHWAAHYGQLECLVQLVQMGCRVNTATSRFNQTPTHTSAFAGHPHCVVWLTQAGADVNQQDCVGEAPIHKAARSGSLECIQVLLMAGAKPLLTNASGQTAADLARAHGFHDCFCFISDAERRLHQLNGNAYGTPCGQDPPSRKRQQLMALDSNHQKRARRAEAAEEQVQSMNVEPEPELNSGHTNIPSNGLSNCHPSTKSTHHVSPPSNRPTTASSNRRSSDMCGSLHLTGSPSSCVSHRPTWWGLMADSGDFLHYGHYHGFGDTAEELSEGGRSEQNGRYKQQAAAGGGATLLYHGS
ncbi:ankyrin repeat domain-containing protein 10a [Gouania willdenowi]|uniref:Ankyrin repeat domain-containing protein 10-like n=1 Tax=Gouania willdenowi TaxID=441366 RepID=A0A8C5G0L8_GOUWI|nr:ankyrin repeat domain-containing protein 10-like [Gouania willdenowi]